MPEGIDTYVSTVHNYPIDVAIGLSLPNAITAIPAGPGGGWFDANPMLTTTAKPAIRIVDGYAISGNNAAIPKNTSTSFWIDAPVAPNSGTQYSISYLSPITWTTYNSITSGTYTKFSTYSVSGHTTLYYITLNSPFYSNYNTSSPVVAGNWIFPTAVNTQTYINAFLDYMAALGPGEKTNQAGLLPRAYRKPSEVQQFSYKLNTRLVKPLIDSGDEVFDGLLQFRGNAGTTDSAAFVDYASSTYGDSTYQPPITFVADATTKSMPYIFVPRNFGHYLMQ